MRSRDYKERLRVLVVDEEVPYPLNTGKRIRTWNLLKRLAQKHDVHFLCYGRAEEMSTQMLKSAGIVVHCVAPCKKMSTVRLYARLVWNLPSTYPFSVVKHYSRRLQKALYALLQEGQWDLIHCEWTPYARFLSRVRHVPVVIGTQNIESQIWQRRAENSTHFVQKIFFHLQKRKMARFERRALLQAKIATAVSLEDAQTMRQWGVERVTVVPNGVDEEFYKSVRQNENSNVILSIASLDWFPNLDALRYFADDIFPLIRKAVPNAIFKVAGRRPPEFLKQTLSSTSGIELIGEISDVRPYLEQASVIVVPLRIGGGSRLKILEALAAGKPVVSTSVGAEGLQLEPSKHVVIADRPAEFAQHVTELLMSPELRRRLGEEGRKFVSTHYAWDTIVHRLEAAWFDCAGKSTPREPMRAVHEVGVA